MAHSVIRLKNKILNNTPLLIENHSLQTILDYLDSRELSGNLTELAITNTLATHQKDGLMGEGTTAYIRVSGALTYEETGWEALCGMTSYQGILSKMQQAADEGYKTVVLDHDSGGGEAYQAFSTSRMLRKIADENDIKLISYVDGISASACYALAVSSHEIITHPQAEVGSIGVVTRLTNTSERDKKEGISTTFIYAGGNKIPFKEDGDFREDFKADLQEKVDELYEGFVNHVAMYRGLNSDVVRSTDARMFTSSKALKLGLIDKIMEVDEFAEYLADIEDEKEVSVVTSLPRQATNEYQREQTGEESMAIFEADKNKTGMKEILAENESLKTQLEETLVSNSTLSAELEAVAQALGVAEEELSKVKAELGESKQKAEELVHAKRKEALAQATNAEQAEALYPSLSTLSDEAYETVVAGFAGKKSDLEASELFQELGEQGAEAEPEQVKSKTLQLAEEMANKFKKQ